MFGKSPNYKDTWAWRGEKLTHTLIVRFENSHVFVVPKIGERGRAPHAPPPCPTPCVQRARRKDSVFMV